MSQLDQTQTSRRPHEEYEVFKEFAGYLASLTEDDRRLVEYYLSHFYFVRPQKHK